jgi:hypothetical protein
MNSGFQSQKPFGQINSSIGPLSLFASTAADEAALYKELGKRIIQCEPEDYVRRLARHICFPTDQLQNRTSRPARPLFTTKDVEDLSEVDLEVFSALYIQNHPCLYRKFESARAVNKDGNPVISWKLEDVLYPKEEGENFTRYLHRLAGLKQERELEQAAKQAARERMLASAQTQPVRSEDIKPSGDSIRLFSRPILWVGAVIILISICGLAVSLHALSLVRYSAAASQPQSAADITLNINFELSRIAELLGSLQKAQATAAAVATDPGQSAPEPASPAELTMSPEPVMPPEKTESPEPLPAAPPPADTGQIFEQLKKDC